MCCDASDTCIDDRCCPAEHTCGPNRDICCLGGEGGSQECVANACCNNDRICGANGEVCCPEGSTCCGEQCVTILDDPQHCGACGRTCADGEACIQGGCLQDGDYRIVLTWHQGGFLYSHLWLPDQPGLRAHIDFEMLMLGNPQRDEPPFAVGEMIPADVRYPLLYVPQATTIFQVLSGGRYIFAVESPPSRSDCSPQTETVGTADAVVEIFVGSQTTPLRTYTVPSNPTPPWDTRFVRYWHVFDLEWTDAGVQIIDVNESTDDPYPYPDPEETRRKRGRSDTLETRGLKDRNENGRNGRKNRQSR